MRIERVEVLRNAARGGHLRMIRAGRDQALQGIRLIEVVSFVGEALEEPRTHHHQSLVRAVGLVEREEIDVRAELRHVG